MKILWIAPRWPEPANDGAKIATHQLLRHLTQQSDFEISYISLLPETEMAMPISAFSLNEILVLRRPKPRTTPALQFIKNPLMPVTFTSFLSQKIRDALEKLVRETAWDRIVFDGLHAAIPFLRTRAGLPEFSFPKSNAKIYYRAHNVEFALWDRTAALAKFPKRQALALQAKLVRHFERSLIQRCERVLPVSEDDARIFIATEPTARSTVIRIGQDFETAPRPTQFPQSESLVFGFIGKLDWVPNRQGLEWFLKEVWPQTHRANPGLKLLIAGGGESGSLRNLLNQPGIEFLGRVDSVESFYSRIDAAVVPLFIGSGTRVKVIEASRFHVPSISTAIGVEGCPLRDGTSYVRAETAEQWTAALSKADRATLVQIGEQAFTTMKSQYDSSTIASELATLFR